MPPLQQEVQEPDHPQRSRSTEPRQHGISPSIQTDRNAEKPSRGRPKQFQFKQLDSLGEDRNPLTELIQLHGKDSKAELNARETYEKEAVWKLISKYCEQKNEKEFELNEEDKLYEVTLGRGLALLIHEVRENVGLEDFGEELVLLITIYISYVIEETEDQNVLNNGSVSLLPEFANLFILYDLGKRCERLKLGQTWICTQSVVVEVLNIFFRWLNYKKFTHTLVTVNEEYGEGE